ncbi:MAG: peroxiredoxin family protein [bacterium]
MRRWILFGLFLLVFSILFYPLYMELVEVSNTQAAKESFQDRVSRVLGSKAGAVEWRGREDRNQFVASSEPARGSTSIEKKFLKSFQFIRGGLPKEAPDFTATGLDGKTWKLSRLRGNWVVLNFWASWCPSCRQEMPSLNRLWKTFRDRNFVLLGVNVQETRNAAHEFVEAHELKFPIVLDRDGSIATKYRVTGIPETIIIDPGGRALGKSIGYRLWDKPPARKFFKKVLKEQ